MVPCMKLNLQVFIKVKIDPLKRDHYDFIFWNQAKVLN
jgi:hypothetical protein